MTAKCQRQSKVHVKAQTEMKTNNKGIGSNSTFLTETII